MSPTPKNTAQATQRRSPTSQPAPTPRATSGQSLASGELEQAQAAPRAARPEAILALQRTIGNQAVQRLLVAHARPLGAGNGPQGAIQRQIIKAETTNGRVFFLDPDAAAAAVREKMGVKELTEAQREKIGDLFESGDPFSVGEVATTLMPKAFKSEVPTHQKIEKRPPQSYSSKDKRQEAKHTGKNTITSKPKPLFSETYQEQTQQLEAAVMEKMGVEELTEAQEIKLVEMSTSENFSIPEIANLLRKMESQLSPSQWLAEAQETFFHETDLKQKKKLADREKTIGKKKNATKKELPASTVLNTTQQVTPLAHQIDNATGNHDLNALGILNEAPSMISDVWNVGQDIKGVINSKGAERKEAYQQLGEDGTALVQDTLKTASQVSNSITQLGGSEAAKAVPFLKVGADAIDVAKDGSQVVKNIGKVVTNKGEDRRKAGKKVLKHGGNLIKDSATMTADLCDGLEKSGVAKGLGMMPIMGAVTGGISTVQDTTHLIKKGNLVLEQKGIRKEAKQQPFQEALAAALQSFIDTSEAGMAKDGVKVLSDVGSMVGSILTASGIGAVAGVPISAIGLGLNLAAESAEKVREYWAAHKANDAEKEFNALKQIRNDHKLAAQIVLCYARAERDSLPEGEEPNPQAHPALCTLQTFGIEPDDLASSDDVLRQKMLGKIGKRDKKYTTAKQDVRKVAKIAKKFNPLDLEVSDKEDRKSRKISILARLKNLMDGKDKRDSNWEVENANMSEEKMDLDINAALHILNYKMILTSKKSEEVDALEQEYLQLIGKKARFDTSNLEYSGDKK